MGLKQVSLVGREAVLISEGPLSEVPLYNASVVHIVGIIPIRFLWTDVDFVAGTKVHTEHIHNL